jgi:hypothetical protein
VKISDSDVAAIDSGVWPDWIESHDDIEHVARSLAKEVAGLRNPVITIHHVEKPGDEIEQRIAAMQLGRSAVQAITVDAGPMQTEVDRLKRLLARYVYHVGEYEGEDFIDLGFTLTDDERDEIRAIVAEVAL